MTPYQCPCQDASTIILYYDILLYYRNTAQITIIVDSNPHNQFLTGGFNNLEEFGLRSLGWGAEFGISFSGNRAVIVYNINLVVLYTVLGKLGPGQLGPGQLGPGQLGPGQLGPGAQFATF